MTVFIEYWLKCRCPHCNADNWLYVTHSERVVPSRDLYAFKCYSCGTCSWLGKETEEIARGEYDVENGPEDIAIEGMHTPH